jgi:hypothetical protein
MLLTDYLMETIQTYEKLGIQVSGVALGYSHYYHLTEVIRLAITQNSQDSSEVMDMLSAPTTYLGYSIYPLAKEEGIEFLFKDGTSAVKASGITQLINKQAKLQATNVIDFKKKK